MRVGLNLTQFVPGKCGGVQTYAESLARGLAARDDGHRYVLFVNAHTAPLFADLSARCELVHVDVHIPRRARLVERFLPGAVLRAYARGFDALLRRARLDVLHFPLSFLVPFGYPGRTVVTFLDLLQEFHPEFFTADELRWRERNYRPSAHRASHLIAISHFTARSLVERYGVPAERITAVHLAADLDGAPPPAPAEALSLPPRYFCYPAAFWPHKNHLRLVRAIAGLRSRTGFDLPLVLTGMDAADPSGVRAEVTRLGLERQVHFLGYVTRSQLHQVLRGAAFMIFPSLFEGFGLPVVEAMAVGCPVACSRSTSLPELVGDDGYLFDPESEQDIARAVERLAADAALRDRLRRSLALRARRFRTERMIDETVAVYERVAGAVRRRAAG